MTSADIAQLEDAWRKLLYELKTAPEKARELTPNWAAKLATEALERLRGRLQALTGEVD